MSNLVKIFDTTLRDGEQSPGASMNIEEKMRLAHKLAQLGVDIIEVGFPASSPGDFDSVNQIAQQVKGPIICGLARTGHDDINTCWEAIKPAEKKTHPRVHRHQRHPSGAQAQDQPRRGPGRDQVRGWAWPRACATTWSSAPEDASRSDPEFLAQAISTALAAGATTINIPDTVGYALPEEFSELFRYLYKQVPDLKNVTVSVHCHDDLGMAVANSLAGVNAGGAPGGGVHQRHRRTGWQRLPGGSGHAPGHP